MNRYFQVSQTLRRHRFCTARGLGQLMVLASLRSPLSSSQRQILYICQWLSWLTLHHEQKQAVSSSTATLIHYVVQWIGCLCLAGKVLFRMSIMATGSRETTQQAALTFENGLRCRGFFASDKCSIYIEPEVGTQKLHCIIYAHKNDCKYIQYTGTICLKL